MHPEMASVLAGQHHRELTRQAGQWRAAAGPGGGGGGLSPLVRFSSSAASGWHAPRYRVSWSRTTLSAAGVTGRRERSWVIVISATRGL
jgi:hypothetical protein